MWKTSGYAAHRTLPAVLGLAILLAGCIDAPGVTNVPGGLGSFALAPSFSMQGGGGDGSALAAAFDQVNRLRVVLTRIPGGEVALDETVTVSPGQSVYDLTFRVELRSDDESFLAVITALRDEVILFTSSPITVFPILDGDEAPPPVSIVLDYSGPGANATAMEIAPTGVALSPGGTQTFSVEVLDGSGSPVGGVPLVWSVDASSVISVSGSGVVQADDDGKARVTVTSPTGLSASAWVYVVSGEIAYVRGGHLYKGPLSTQGGEDLTPDATAARAPAWSPDGEALYYHQNGKIFQTGLGEPLGDGQFPSVHPDGTKLAVDQAGGVYFMNVDGTHPTEGPQGSNPQWDTDGENLLLAGGSLHRVRADGANRRTLDHAPNIELPFLSASGDRIAYLLNGTFYSVSATGGARAPLLPQGGQEGLEAVSRPTISEDGEWVLGGGISGGTSALYLIPSDGSGPALKMAGTEGASDPAWKPQGSLMEVPEVSVEGYEPAEPGPGDVVVISGSGFDWIIPDNNQILFPPAAFSAPSKNGDPPGVPGEIRGVTSGLLTTVVPQNVGVGPMQIGRSGAAGVQTTFTPTPSTINAFVFKPRRRGVGGIELALLHDGEVVETLTTDPMGQALFPRIDTGVYQLLVTSRDGYSVDGQNPQELLVGIGQALAPEVPLTPELHQVLISPEQSTLKVGEVQWFYSRLLDIDGDPLGAPPPFRWIGDTDHIGVSTFGNRGMAQAVYPTLVPEGSSLTFAVEGQAAAGLVSDVEQTRTFPITVTSHIGGLVSDPGGSGLPRIRITLYKGDELEQTSYTDQDGRYVFRDLLGGAYQVRVEAPAGFLGNPENHPVTLDRDTPLGEADFIVQAATPSRIVGNVYDGLTGASVAGAQVEITPAGASAFGVTGNALALATVTTTTDASGGFDSGAIQPGDYRVVVTADGYLPGTASVQVPPGETVTMSPIGLIRAGGPGVLQGTVRDATSRMGLPGVTVELRQGAGASASGPVFLQTTAGSTGFYSFTNLPAGNYTVRATSPGYAPGQASVAVPPDVTTNRDVLLSPQLAEGEVRIVLIWGTNLPNVPSDLDSHLTGPLSTGGRFHIAYYNRGSLVASPWAYLHNDDTYYEGPETTTITQQLPGVYRFSVYLYCCGTTVRYSQAQVQVFDHTGLVASFSVPNQDGRLWNVFEMENGVIRPINTMDGPFDPVTPGIQAPMDFRAFVETMPRKGGG